MFIARREKEDNPYTRLQKHSTEMVQQLSNRVWSDFNPHDPGVTILDLLHYALLELEYQLEFPLEEYLGGTTDSPLCTTRFGIPTAEALFSDSIVTPADYEKLILEQRIEGVQKCRVTLGERNLYRIILEVADEADLYGIRTAVEQVYHAHRNLCENLGEIGFGKISGKANRTPDERPSIRPDLSPVCSSGMVTGAYRSVQRDFPDCYGINENGLPTGISQTHHARIRQLKGYLLIFDHLLGDVAQQAATIPGLFEMQGRPSPHPLPEIRIPGGSEELVDEERKRSATGDRSDFLERQRSNYLDRLDVIYGEDTAPLFAHVTPERSEINRMRAELITRLPRLQAKRFRSFNLLDENPASISGAKEFLSALTGFSLAVEKPLTNIFSHYGLKIVRDYDFFGRHSQMPRIEFLFSEAGHNWDPHDTEPVPPVEVSYNEQSVQQLRKQIHLLQYGLIFESFLLYGPCIDCYRLVYVRERQEYLLVFKHPHILRWIHLGTFPSRDELVETAHLLHHFLTRLTDECSSFYLLEHLLLSGADTGIAEAETCTLSVLAPHWVQRLHDPLLYEQRIRERLPAHIEVRFLWLHSDTLYAFERLYFPWKKALAGRHSLLAGRLAFRLRNFLKNNTPSHEHHPQNNP